MDGEDYTRERLVASFMEVTGVANTVDACEHLVCCGWNLDEAVDLFLSIGAGPSGSRSPPPPSYSSVPDDRRRLARSGSRWDSETRVSSSSSSSRRRRRRQRFRERGDDDEEEDGDEGGRRRRVRARVGRVDDDAARVEVDRDLTSRLQRYDEALNSGSKDKKSSAPAKKKKEEEKSLEDLFRPPRELTFPGGFHDAKLDAARRGRWLLVNVQDTGDAALASFAQNRDVWASSHVARFVRDHFVLWQADAADAEAHGAGQAEAAEPEARKVCAHYGVPLDKLPAVLVVDPVTGQAVARLHGASTDPNDFLVAVKSYVATKPVVPVIRANKPGASAAEPVNQQPAKSQRTANRQDVRPKVEKQDKAVPAVATAAPIVEKQVKAVASVPTVAPTVEKQSKAVHQAVAAAVPTVQPAPPPVPKVCKLRIRMPDGRTVAKEFASGCPVAALFAYCRSELGEGGEAGRNKPFRLVRLVGCTREEIGDRDVSFQNLGLHLSTVSVLLG